jgi:hypothetical protein
MSDDKQRTDQAKLWFDKLLSIEGPVPWSRLRLGDLLGDTFGFVQRKKRRGKWPLVLEILKERFPIEQHPDGFPDPAFVPRKPFVKELRTLHPSLGSLDEETLDKAIAEYDRLAIMHRAAKP